MSDAAHYEKCIRNLVGLHHQHYVDALLAEHRAALSRARADALEEAAITTEHAPAGGNRNDYAERIRRRALGPKPPAPATIPVERVLEMLMRHATLGNGAPDPGIHAAARDLGVDLDAKGKECPCLSGAVDLDCAQHGSPRS